MKKILSLIKKGVNAYLNALTKCPYTPTGTIPFGIQFLLFRVDNIIYLGPQLNRLEQLTVNQQVVGSSPTGPAEMGRQFNGKTLVSKTRRCEFESYSICNGKVAKMVYAED